MKPNQDDGTYAVARALVEVSSLVMRRVRAVVRRQRTAGLTYTQIRTLSAVASRQATSVSDVAEFLGLGLPTTSKVINELVRRGLMVRRSASDDRRRVLLASTEAGKQLLKEAAEPAYAAVAEMLEPLDPAGEEAVLRVMELLQPLVLPAGRCGEDDEGE
jgi:DNA-binding MarR family transcriptional regulator